MTKATMSFEEERGKTKPMIDFFIKPDFGMSERKTPTVKNMCDVKEQTEPRWIFCREAKTQ